EARGAAASDPARPARECHARSHLRAESHGRHQRARRAGGGRPDSGLPVFGALRGSQAQEAVTPATSRRGLAPAWAARRPRPARRIAVGGLRYTARNAALKRRMLANPAANAPAGMGIMVSPATPRA